MDEFAQFSTGVLKGLAQAYTTDIDVFLLFTAGGLLGARSRPLRALGGALGAYTVLRRTDTYVDVLNSKLMMLARVMADANHPRYIYPGQNNNE